MTKRQKINLEYAEFYNLCSAYIDENGWCFQRKNVDFEKLKSKIKLEYFDDNFRPKSLNGIETNNGWIKFSDSKPFKETASLITLLRTYHNNLKVFTTTTISSFDYHEEPELYKQYSHWKYKELDIAPLY